MGPNLTFWNCRNVHVASFARRAPETKNSKSSINLHIDYDDFLPHTEGGDEGRSYHVAGRVCVMLHGIEDDLLERLIEAFRTEQTEDCSDPNYMPF